MHKTHMALYGNVAILRAWCPDCKDWSWVLDGKLACCDRENEHEPRYYKREVEPEGKRKQPPKWMRDAQLEEQGGRCLYCEKVIGSHIWRNGKRIKLRLHWDHLVPYSLTQNNNAVNFVAACHICNGIKSSHCFQTIDEARIYILDRWERKGIR